MTKPVSMTPSHTFKLEKDCVEDSKRWFGDQGMHTSVPHMVLAMCGEVGEVANIIKKIERGSLDIKEAKVRRHLAEELADVYTYLLNVCGMLNVDLERAYEVKRGFNNQRFTEERTKREQAATRNNIGI